MAEQNNQAERAAPLSEDELWAISGVLRTAGKVALARRVADLASASRASLPAAVDAVDLPPLPSSVDCVRVIMRGDVEFLTPCEDYFTSEQYRQGQREAIAADRRKRAMTQPALAAGTVEKDAVSRLVRYGFRTEQWETPDGKLNEAESFCEIGNGDYVQLCDVLAAIEAHNKAGKER